MNKSHFLRQCIGNCEKTSKVAYSRIVTGYIVKMQGIYSHIDTGLLFETHLIKHWFCPKCGSSIGHGISFEWGNKSVNARATADVQSDLDCD